MGLTLTFLGTRGEIKARSRLHRRHSSLMIRRGRARLMVDCGTDWLRAVRRLKPTAIVLTHGHPDHAHGLAHGAPCPVYATARTWKTLPAYPIRDRRKMPLRKPLLIGGVRFEAFPVEHSTRAPAVGYRISGGGARFFYVPDVVAIRDKHRALGNIGLYVGDGAVIKRRLIRKIKGALVGHTSIQAQLRWCRGEGVKDVIITHCGTEIVTGEAGHRQRLVRQMGAKFGVNARIAHDGLRLLLPGRGSRVRTARRRRFASR